jgi:hypothetical protein
MGHMPSVTAAMDIMCKEYSVGIIAIREAYRRDAGFYHFNFAC